MEFHEYLVKRKLGPSERLVTVLLYVAATFFMFCCIDYLGMLGGIENLLIVAGYWVAYHFASRLKKEFEYTCTEDVVDIDVIFNESKRKELISFSVKDVEIIASMKDNEYKHLREGHFDKVIDASTLRKEADVYFAILEREGRTIVKFEPPVKCLEYLRPYAPSKIKIYQNERTAED